MLKKKSVQDAETQATTLSSAVASPPVVQNTHLIDFLCCTEMPSEQAFLELKAHFKQVLESPHLAFKPLLAFFMQTTLPKKWTNVLHHLALAALDTRIESYFSEEKHVFLVLFCLRGVQNAPECEGLLLKLKEKASMEWVLDILLKQKAWRVLVAALKYSECGGTNFIMLNRIICWIASPISGSSPSPVPRLLYGDHGQGTALCLAHACDCAGCVACCGINSSYAAKAVKIAV